jgi:hypothetical protein
MRTFFVVDMTKVIELLLQGGDGVGGRLTSQPPFERLVEAFDFALGLGVGRMSVLLVDLERVQ